MNDIERLAAAIRQNRLNAKQEGTLEPEIDIELADEGTHQPDVPLTPQVESTSDAANDTLLCDVGSDFGLDSSEGERAQPEFTTKQKSSLTQSSHSRAFTLSGQEAPSIVLPIEKLADKGFITPLTERGLITEQYRRIKRPLLKNLNRSEKDGIYNNVIMVTSSISGEGKTFTAINLAMSLALERERTVLLVDADVLKNSASGVLEVDRSKLGLTDLLSGSAKNPSDVILRTNISNFTYLPSGSTQRNTNELLSSGRMKQLIEDLSNRYHDRIIVLDCPPILQTNEANVISEYAGQVVFVVAEEDTSQGFVIEALKQIPDDRYVGVVLNKSRKRMLGNDYSYAYDYV